ncbi:sulfatase-like hydrolase/transferase [Novipirellula herctigrandis]
MIIKYLRLLLSLAVSIQVAINASAAEKPNVLFIAIDDMNDWTTLFDDDNPIQTPNLKRLAARGCFFSKAYCASPGCNPSRTAIMTGLRPTTSGVYGNPDAWRQIIPDAVTLPQYFKRHGGYATRGAGKIFHHGKSGAGDPDNPDFEQFFKKLPIRGPGQNKNYNGYRKPPNRRLSSVGFDWGEHDQKMIDVDMCEWVEARMEEKWDKPLFLAAGIFNPHLPFYAPKETFSRYPLENIVMPDMPNGDLSDVGEVAKRMVRKEFWIWDNTTAAKPGSVGSLRRMVQCYQAAADFSDQMVGRLLDKLDESGRADNTIIVLWSDHGYHLGDKECCVKFTLWDKANHVPFIIVAPGVTMPGSRCDTPVGLIDIYPTLLELARLPAKADNDGVSLVPLLKNPDRKWDRPALMTEGPGNHAVRSDRWRYIRYSDGAQELYDHENDPWEHKNLVADPEHAEVISAHRKWLPKHESSGKGMSHLYMEPPTAGAGLPESGFSRPRTAVGGEPTKQSTPKSEEQKRDENKSTPAASKQTDSVKNASPVPRFHFADTLEEQEKQLAENPLLKRFRKSREKLLKDRHHPIYHFTSPEHRLNDPNGLSYWNGKWHMFYQGYPPEYPRQHWGHAISDDLIHWRDLPYAIYPGPERACFSGTVYIDHDTNRAIAMYHGTEVGTMVATSSDPLLLNWKKVTGNAVIPYPQPGEPKPEYNIFDPCVWKKGDWYYALTAGPKGGMQFRSMYLHRSKDLATWEHLHEFLENDRYSLAGDDGACPYFWPIGTGENKQHILLHFSHMSGGKYMLGDYDTDRDKFLVSDGGDFNFGAWGPCGLHAPSAYPDGKGGVNVVFNVNEGKKTDGWNRMMSLPRNLTLRKNGLFNPLNIEPAGEVESLRGEHVHVAEMNLPANKEVVLDNVKGNAMEIVANFAPQFGQTIELNVLRSPDGEEVTRIQCFRDRGMRILGNRTEPPTVVSIDSSRSTIAGDVIGRPPETAQVDMPSNEPLKLRVFIDRSIVEVFINGRQCLTARVYPDRNDSLDVSLRSQGNDAKLMSLDAWQMKNIYE